ncbi:hypothetical protein C7B82_07950 [Stenomitos frigidus ULC18]|uniref:Uncharacterized protein n=1 Tax=Stenomitos frigidus ULC18 TaxID=2107698 RepID=A0A2T1EDU0_9CYAN|nr:hypothetical protein C7B82_07950 [Stenomitos frigidus ULC18]
MHLGSALYLQPVSFELITPDTQSLSLTDLKTAVNSVSVDDHALPRFTMRDRTQMAAKLLV